MKISSNYDYSFLNYNKNKNRLKINNSYTDENPICCKNVFKCS